MNDTFAEQLVTKEPDSSDKAKKTLTAIFGGILVMLLILASMKNFLLIIFPTALVFVLYRLITNFNIEYEYSVTNGSLDVDKIIAKRKRVSMISVDAKDFTAFDSYQNADVFSGTTIMTVGGDEEPYYAEFKNETYGEVRLVFSPDERVLNCIRPYLPGNIKH